MAAMRAHLSFQLYQQARAGSRGRSSDMSQMWNLLQHSEPFSPSSSNLGHDIL